MVSTPYHPQRPLPPNKPTDKGSSRAKVVPLKAGQREESRRKGSGGGQPPRPPRAPRRPAPLSPRRLITLGVMLTAVLVGLIVRGAQIQIGKAGTYADLAQQQWYTQRLSSPERGQIVDRNGETLALSMPAETLIAEPDQITDPQRVAEQLAPILQTKAEQLLPYLQDRTHKAVYLGPQARQLSEEQVRQIKALHIAGLDFVAEEKRDYPNHLLAADVLGFTDIDGRGLTGVEQEYDALLRGRAGQATVAEDAAGNPLAHTQQQAVLPKNGENLRLTIDLSLQQKVESVLDQAVATYHPQNVTAILADPQTGAILAMADRPAFDPNQPGKAPPAVRNDNLAIWSAFEPGSTFKMVTLAAALDTHAVTLKDTYFDKGYVVVQGRTIHDWDPKPRTMTVEQLFEQSSNPGFVWLQQKMGVQTLYRYIDRFGFGQKTGIDLPGEQSGQLFDPAHIQPVEAATTAFGQGISVTPIQQVMAACAIANGGLLLRPYVVADAIDPQTGQVTTLHARSEVRRVISEQTAALVRQAMQGVVSDEHGTATAAQIPGYSVAGKTGTAQVPNPNGKGYLPGNQYVLSFLGFAPASDPKVVLFLAVDQPQLAPGQLSGEVAAPLAKEILSYALPYLGVAPDQSTSGAHKR